jgi:hypothetical protein
MAPSITAPWLQLICRLSSVVCTADNTICLPGRSQREADRVGGDGSSASWNPQAPLIEEGRAENLFSHGKQFFFAKSIISRFSKRSFREEFKIPDGRRDHRRRHQYRRSTPQRGADYRPFCSEDLVITEVSVEILISWIGRNSLGPCGSTLSKHDAIMSRWLNKWIVPLLVAFVTLAAIAIAAFVGYGVHLLH